MGWGKTNGRADQSLVSHCEGHNCVFLLKDMIPGFIFPPPVLFIALKVQLFPSLIKVSISEEYLIPEFSQKGRIPAGFMTAGFMAYSSHSCQNQRFSSFSPNFTSKQTYGQGIRVGDEYQ